MACYFSDELYRKGKYTDKFLHYYNGKADSALSIVGRGCNITVDLLAFENEILKNL